PGRRERGRARQPVRRPEQQPSALPARARRAQRGCEPRSDRGRFARPRPRSYLPAEADAAAAGRAAILRDDPDPPGHYLSTRQGPGPRQPRRDALARTQDAADLARALGRVARKKQVAARPQTAGAGCRDRRGRAPDAHPGGRFAESGPRRSARDPGPDGDAGHGRTGRSGGQAVHDPGAAETGRDGRANQNARTPGARRSGQARVGGFQPARQLAALHAAGRQDRDRHRAQRRLCAIESRRYRTGNPGRNPQPDLRALRAVERRRPRNRIGGPRTRDRQGHRGGARRAHLRNQFRARQRVHRRASRGGLMANLLIVDDEKNIRRSLATYFESCGHHVLMAESAVRALAILTENPNVDLVLSDYRMAEMNGLELLHEIKARFPKLLVILITAYATVESAVEAMKSGAYDYLAKPFSLDQIGHVVDRALEVKALRSENQALRDTIDEVPLLDSKSPAMTALLDVARQAANSEATILLTGESGTGKNVLARQIHLWSPRRERPFVVVNCTTLSEHLLESELFGHVRGSFSGAAKDKPGRLLAADSGTVFLDEIADLPGPLQSKFLRFIEEQNFEPLGDNHLIRVDTRIIAASNQDLEAEVAAQHFREDLFYRLNVITLRVPPLRERREDILPLAEWMLKSATTRHHRPPLSLSPGAAAAISKYHWPGNVRQLRNSLERAVLLTPRQVIVAEDLPDAIFRESNDAQARMRHYG